MTGVQTCALPISIFSISIIIMELTEDSGNLYANLVALNICLDHEATPIAELAHHSACTRHEGYEIGRASCRERV